MSASSGFSTSDLLSIISFFPGFLSDLRNGGLGGCGLRYLSSFSCFPLEYLSAYIASGSMSLTPSQPTFYSPFPSSLPPSFPPTLPPSLSWSIILPSSLLTFLAPWLWYDWADPTRLLLWQSLFCLEPTASLPALANVIRCGQEIIARWLLLVLILTYTVSGESSAILVSLEAHCSWAAEGTVSALPTRIIGNF